MNGKSYHWNPSAWITHVRMHTLRDRSKLVLLFSARWATRGNCVPSCLPSSTALGKTREFLFHRVRYVSILCHRGTIIAPTSYGFGLQLFLIYGDRDHGWKTDWSMYHTERPKRNHTPKWIKNELTISACRVSDLLFQPPGQQAPYFASPPDVANTSELR